MATPIPIPRGTHVQTIYGRGLVAYVRMAGPDYREPAAYSVVLDHKANRPGYTGTVIPAAHVSAWVVEDMNGGSR